MNDKLHDIARQAAEWAKKESTSPWSRPYGELYDEKFAELIVRECMTVCQTIDEEYDGEDVLATWCATEIGKHFGLDK